MVTPTPLLPTCSHVNLTPEDAEEGRRGDDAVSLVGSWGGGVKHGAMLARASRVTDEKAGKVRSGGASTYIVGTAVEARVTVMEKGADTLPKKLLTTRTIVKLSPPSSSAPVRPTTAAALPAWASLAAMG